MLSVNYAANGFTHTPTEEDPRYGLWDLIFWNIMPFKTKVNITLYYENKPPIQMSEFELEPESINTKIVFPQDRPDLAIAGGTLGAKIVSDGLIFVETILVAGQQGSKEKKGWAHLFQGENALFRGGCADILAEPRTTKLWYFADGFLIQKKPPFKKDDMWPFNEIEWYHILNPTKREAKVTMECFYMDGTRDSFTYKVGAEQVLMFDNYNTVKPNLRYGIKFLSTEPVVIQSERLVHGLHGYEEWGLEIHTPRPGIPAPLRWNEEIE